MRETLCFSDLVLNLLQVGQHGCILLLAASITNDGILHGDTHRLRFQRLVVHTDALSVRGRGGKREKNKIMMQVEGVRKVKSENEQASVMLHYLLTCLILHLQLGIWCFACIFGGHFNKSSQSPMKQHNSRALQPVSSLALCQKTGRDII